MRDFCLFLFFLIIWSHTAGAQSIITIEVRESGDALWTMEKRLPLANQTDIEDWDRLIKTEQLGNQEDIEDFSRRIEWFLESAQKFSSRLMKAEKFNVSYDTAKTPSSTFGIIQYSFEWKNFSHSETGRIFIGDAFSEGMVLSQDNVLIIKLPDGYDVLSVTPTFDKRDGNRLIWDGTLYRNFAKGEPSVVIARSWINPWFLLIVFIVIASGSLIMLYRRKRKLDSIDRPFFLEDLTTYDVKYEEMIERFLIESGGQASQSDIIKKIGLSKSRVSTILSKMKEKGRIIKIKHGKGNLIRIVNK
jgi:uncharacterized membrane protein